jgi:DNA-binding MarR family transcriptional regulator
VTDPVEDPISESIVAFVEAYRLEHGVAPSYREISKGCYISRSTVSRHILKLSKQGRVKRTPGHKRSITVVCPENTIKLGE